MKKILFLLLAAVFIFMVAILPVFAQAEINPVAVPETPEIVEAVAEEPAYDPTPGEPLTWEYLATIAGATFATVLIVQYFKVKMDRVWKIPTRVFVYFVALVILLLATYFTKGLTVETAILTVFNAFVVAVAAYGGYEISFARIDRI